MKDLIKIRHQLEDMAEKEAYRLWRIARRALKHGCSMGIVNAIRKEAHWLYTTAKAYPERLLAWDFEYAFR